jgi:hypothetical protein
MRRVGRFGTDNRDARAGYLGKVARGPLLSGIVGSSYGSTV